METKICSKCKRELPKTIEYFSPNKITKDGFEYSCRTCKALYLKQYHEKNKDIISAQRKEYRNLNREKILEQKKKYREANKDKIKKYSKKYNNKNEVKNRMKNWRKINKNRIIECREKWRTANKDKLSIYANRYYSKNREKILQSVRLYSQENKDKVKLLHKKYAIKNSDKLINYRVQYYKKNKEKLQLTNKTWKLRNKDKVNVINQKRRTLKKQLIATLTNTQWLECKTYFKHKCAYCDKQLKNLTQEHVIPIAKGGGYAKQNIIPACRSCNCSKQDKDMETWFRNQTFFSEERLEKIYQWMGVKNNVQQIKIL